MIGYIYKITSPTNRIYIGQTQEDRLLGRQSDYKNNKCKNQTLIYNSIKKHSWETHKFEIIDQVPYLGFDNWLIDLFEIYWIKEYKSNYNRFPEYSGMNLTDGGSVGNRGMKHSNKTKEVLRLKSTGVKQSEETISRKIKGMKEHYDLFGKKMPEGYKPFNIIEIDCFLYKTGEYIGRFESYAECGRKLNFKTTHVAAVIQGKRPHTNGYTFKKVT